MIYENKKKNDQIASSTGKSSFTDSQRLSAGILPSILTQTLHAAPVICHFGIAAVSENRLSRHHTNAQGLLRSAQGLGIRKDTALLHPMLCRKKAAKKRAFEKLLTAIFKQARLAGLIEKKPQGAVDATGLEARYTSQHYIRCTKRTSFYRRNWPKLTIICHTKTHLIAGCIVTRGPSLDFPNLPEVVKGADKQVKFDQILADAGYDSEANHYFCREVLNIRSTVIAYNARGASKPPTAKYRRQMANAFDKKAYNNRWQVESVFSRHKRLLGSSLRNRTELSRERECLLRVLTHNLMIIRRAA